MNRHRLVFCRHALAVLAASAACSDEPAANTPDPDAGTTTDGGDDEVELVACQDVVHELPVVTHWSAETHDVVYLASGTESFTVPYPDGDYVPGDCYPEYRIGRRFFPSYESYVGMNFSTTAVSDAAAASWAQQACDDTGVAFQVMRPDALPDRLRSRPGYVQVVSGVVVAEPGTTDPGSLITLMLPANWRAGAAAGSYPIVINGYYDLNASVFFREAGRKLAGVVAASSIDGHTGAIVINWNGGGGEASYTIDERVDRHLAAIVDLAETLGGDRDRVLTVGGSRGGLSAVAMASRHHGAFRPVFVAAAAAAGDISVLPDHLDWTYPDLLMNTGYVTGLRDAWRPGWTYPGCAGHPELTGLSTPQAMLQILTGDPDLDPADPRNPASPASIQALVDAGTSVHLSMGTHDKLAYLSQLAYARALEAAGVPTHVDLEYRGGHGGAGSHFPAVTDAVLALTDPGDGVIDLAPGWSYFALDRATGEAVADPAASDLPFTFEGPYVMPRGNSTKLVFTGVGGTEYRLVIDRGQGAGRVELADVRGQIPIDGVSEVQTLSIPAQAPAGTYDYRLSIRKPSDVAFREIPRTNTPAIAGSPAVLVIWETTPNVSDEQLANAIEAMRPLGWSNNWGLSER